MVSYSNEKMHAAGEFCRKVQWGEFRRHDIQNINIGFSRVKRLDMFTRI